MGTRRLCFREGLRLKRVTKCACLVFVNLQETVLFCRFKRVSIEKRKQAQGGQRLSCLERGPSSSKTRGVFP